MPIPHHQILLLHVLICDLFAQVLHPSAWSLQALKCNSTSLLFTRLSIRIRFDQIQPIERSEINLEQSDQNSHWKLWVVIIKMKKNNQAQDRITPEELGFPSKIGDFVIEPVSWDNFPAPSPEDTWFLAYTYWTNNYKIHFVTRNNVPSKFRITFATSISPKSWRNRDGESLELLQHQYGHYLINCVMALDFRLKANQFGRTCQTQQMYQEFCDKLFGEKRKQYGDKQKLYDKESNHYLNRKGQEKWEAWMKEQILSYSRKQKQFEEETKELQKKQLVTNSNTNVNKITYTQKPAPKNNPQVQAPRKDFSTQKAQKMQSRGNTKNPSMPKHNIKPLNVMKMMGDLYKKQQY